MVRRRCRGLRMLDGHRCERRILTRPDADASELYCHLHRKKGSPAPIALSMLLATGRKRKVKADEQTEAASSEVHMNGGETHAIFEEEHESAAVKRPQPIYDCWSLWINPRVKPTQQQNIRAEMRKPISEHDKPGYIYAYSLKQGPRVPTSRYAYFKIGRTANPLRRMYQVSQKCKYKPNVMEIFPRFPPREVKLDGHTLERLEWVIEQLPKCPLAGRVERLILWELGGTYRHAGFRCPQCNIMHREWIRVARHRKPDGTMTTDREVWNLRVRPVILRWIQYGVAASSTHLAHQSLIQSSPPASAAIEAKQEEEQEVEIDIEPDVIQAVALKQ
ncbi:hypothetical protein EC973_001244 [Apophysomyces ossiformis]|uniref:Bacteriophage T5 Orf172 DNA-binding domain-containing protein n=1 Tax=Apophysomyces ossiformis TaxID=679940 RepID=A0A8H7ES05_9FUNG|nr:hypothetical protein EC973_001244 [Apophysomyces ossiformis]